MGPEELKKRGRGGNLQRDLRIGSMAHKERHHRGMGVKKRVFAQNNPAGHLLKT